MAPVSADCVRQGCPYGERKGKEKSRAVLNGEKKKCSGTSFSTKSPRALHVPNHGWWRLAVGGWRRLAVGGWRRLAVGSWQLAVGGG